MSQHIDPEVKQASIEPTIVSSVPFATGIYYCTAAQTIAGISIPAYCIYDVHVYGNDGSGTVIKVGGANSWSIGGTAGTWGTCVAISDPLLTISNATSTGDVLASALLTTSTKLFKGNGSTYSGTLPASIYRYGNFLVTKRDGNTIVFAMAQGHTAVNYHNGSVWAGWIEFVPSDYIVNNLTTTSSGYALDARQGKALNDQITTLNNKIVSNTGGVPVRQAGAVANNSSFTVSLSSEYSTNAEFALVCLNVSGNSAGGAGLLFLGRGTAKIKELLGTFSSSSYSASYSGNTWTITNTSGNTLYYTILLTK